MAEPLISIVIPVFKPDAFFIDTLVSIQQQTVRGFEVVISDDSPEQTNIQEYATRFPDLEIKYVKNETGKGIFQNLNNAIRHSSGDFIQIFCQDDIMLPDLLQNQMNLFRQFPTIGMGFSRYVDIDGEGKPFAFHPHMTAAVHSWKAFIPKAKAENYLFVYGCIPGSLSPVMLKREVIEQVGYFNPDFLFAGDFEYWIRTARAFDMAFNKAVSLQVRSHQNRASHSLGYFKLLPDVTTLYRGLYKSNTVRASQWRKRLQVNNMSVGYLIYIFKSLAAGRLKSAALLRFINRSPYNVLLIFLILLQRKMTGKVRWYIKESEC